MKLGVVIVHPWKNYDRPGFYKLVGYPLDKLHEVLERKRLGTAPCSANGTDTQFFRVEMEELENLKVWDSGWVWLGREETTWKNIEKQGKRQ